MPKSYSKHSMTDHITAEDAQKLLDECDSDECLTCDLARAVIALTKERDAFEGNAKDAYEKWVAEHARAEAADAKLAKAVEALWFYADKDLNGYDVCITDYGLSLEVGPIIKDAGDLAQSILKEITE